MAENAVVPNRDAALLSVPFQVPVIDGLPDPALIERVADALDQAREKGVPIVDVAVGLLH